MTASVRGDEGRGGALDIILIEILGNPVCRVRFDLGEHFRIAVLNTREGDDQPAKYLLLLRAADSIVVSKMDLLGAARFSLDRATSDMHAVNDGATVLQASEWGRSSTKRVADWMAARARSPAHVPGRSSCSVDHPVPVAI